MREIRITYSGVTLDIKGQYYEGCNATYMYPADPTEFQSTAIVCGDQDITDLLDGDTITEIENLAAQQIQDEEEYHDSFI